jgi:putative glutamine amidotransferase
VSVAPGTQLDRVLGIQGFEIDSHHHQAVEALGDGLVASAYADDGVVEAIEAPGEAFTLGVQWHPEENLAPEGTALFAAFIRAATNCRLAPKDREAALRS